MSFANVVLLVGSGFLAGIVNAVAAGAALVTFPALVAVGLSAIDANATSAVALIPGSLAIAFSYRHKMYQHRAELPLLSLISVAGGLAGGLLLLKIGDQGFQQLVPWLIAAATIALALGGIFRKMQDGPVDNVNTVAGKVAAYVSLFGVSVYGGFFGAGMGFVLMATLTLLEPSDYHKSNATKNLMAILSPVAAVLLFIFNHLVSWPHAVLVMAGGVIGGYFGGSIAQSVPEVYLRTVMIAFGSVASIVFFLR